MALNLDARHRAMLDAMGIRLWARPQPTEAEAAAFTAEQPSAPVAAHVEAVRAVVPTKPTVVAPPRHAAPSQRTHRAAAGDAPALEPLPAGIDQMGWEQLEAAVAVCRACPLWTGRTQTVFGTGSHYAEWMVVGEAPGANEDRLGEPFVGQAGKLLDNMLAAMGLSRSAELEGRDPPPAAGEAARPRGVYIANVVKCRPPGNRNPEPFEVATCEHYLKRQIALLQPKILLAMGRFAVQALLQSGDPIGRLRGRIYRYEGVPVIVTYHPAYLLRNPADKAKAWQDLCLALDTFAASGAG